MKKFEIPELEIVKLSCDDIITTSGGCSCHVPVAQICYSDCQLVNP